MADSYVISETVDPSVDGTTEVVLERGPSGKVIKAISTERSAQLNKKDLNVLKNLGIRVKKVSAAESSAPKSSAPKSGSDTAGAAPSLGSGKTDN